MEICDPKHCTGCMCCANICNKGAISAINDEQGFLRPHINQKLCVDCGRCSFVCPSNNNPKLTLMKQTNIIYPKVLAAWTNNKIYREVCTSGGIATELAKYIIDCKGSVFGAAYGDGFAVKHIKVDQISSLDRIMGSKYVQSNIDDIYIEIKELLLDSRRVMFIGTPCQVAGITNYCLASGLNMDNLFTIDILCHGAPSPLIFSEYISLIEETYGKCIKSINQRKKCKSWLTYATEIVFEDNSKLIEYKEQNQYTEGFFSNLFLRPSCYSCPFASTDRVGDITLGDFWGYIETNSQDKDTDKGISLVMINTEKGNILFNAIRSNVICFERPIEEAVNGNPTLSGPSSVNPKYTDFWSDHKISCFKDLFNKYCKPSKIKWEEVSRYVSIHYTNTPELLKKFLRRYYYYIKNPFKNKYLRH